MFLAGNVVALVDGAVHPLFFTAAVLEIIGPLSFIPRTIDMVVDSFSICLIIDPVTFIYVSVHVCKITESMSTIVLPETLITGSI